MPAKVLTPGLSSLVILEPHSELSTEEQILAGVALGTPRVYIATPGGKFYLRQVLGDPANNRHILTETQTIPGYTHKDMAVTPTINFLPNGKVPFKMLEDVLTFFRAVCTKHSGKLEAMIWICWSREQGYHLVVPDQVVSAASAKYEIIVDIHSHGGMGAFFSGTDDNDDTNSIRFSGVLGKVMDLSPEHKFRFNCMGRRLEVKLEDVFLSRPTEVPEEWLERVKTLSAPTVVGGTSPAVYQGGHQTGYHGGVAYSSPGAPNSSPLGRKGGSSEAAEEWARRASNNTGIQAGTPSNGGAGRSTPNPTNQANTGNSAGAAEKKGGGQSASSFSECRTLDGRPIQPTDDSGGPEGTLYRSGFGIVRRLGSAQGGLVGECSPKSRASQGK
jgi:hypothetical protein